MLILKDNEVFILLPKQMSMLDPFFNNVEDEYKSFLADKDEHGNYVVKPPMPLDSKNVTELTKSFDSVLANRMTIKQVANFLICFAPLCVAFLLLYNLRQSYLLFIMLVLFALCYIGFAVLSNKLIKWHHGQVQAAEAVKQYIYVAFNVTAVEDIQKATDIIKKQEAHMREMDQNFKTVKEINDVVRRRYGDLTQRVSKNMLDEHMAYCRIKHPALDEYETTKTQSYH